jgi:hypothetical protein
LHSNRPAPYSSHMDWYAVKRTSGDVYGYDINEEKLLPLSKSAEGK